MKERVLQLVRLAGIVTGCVEQLAPEDQLVLEIWADEYGEKIMRICEVLEVSEPTAYRRKDRVLHRLSELFRENGMRIS